MVHGAGARASSSARVARRAADIEVAEQTETKPISYLENIPRTIIEKRALDKLLTTLPRDQWEDPPESSYLYTLKCYAEVYGEGKATRMGWWDFYYLKITRWEADEELSGEQWRRDDEWCKMIFRD